MPYRKLIKIWKPSRQCPKSSIFYWKSNGKRSLQCKTLCSKSTHSSWISKNKSCLILLFYFDFYQRWLEWIPKHCNIERWETLWTEIVFSLQPDESWIKLPFAYFLLIWICIPLKIWPTIYILQSELVMKKVGRK